MSGYTWDVLDQSYRALRAAVAGIPADAWAQPTPSTAWNVTQVLQHAAGDQLAYASSLTGGAGPGYDPFSPSGTLDAAGTELLEAALTVGAETFGEFDPEQPDTEVAVPLPPFKLPVGLAVQAAALDAAVHAWDIAVATGQPSPLTLSLAQAVRPAADALADPLRGFAFGPAIQPSADADDIVRLLNFLGRDENWGK
jgi:uncharacterized protein (TIGR03086 family)